MRVLIVKYANEPRESILQTHDGEQVDALPALELQDVECLVNDTIDVVAVDEGQFYEDLVEFCERWANEGKVVLVAALDGTYERKPFQNVSRLLSQADSVTKLQAICFKCQGNASFTARISGERGDILLGGEEKYAACCRKCWMASNNVE